MECLGFYAAESIQIVVGRISAEEGHVTSRFACQKDEFGNCELDGLEGGEN